jgi:hypothetical protein
MTLPCLLSTFQPEILECAAGHALKVGKILNRHGSLLCLEMQRLASTHNPGMCPLKRGDGRFRI